MMRLRAASVLALTIATLPPQAPLIAPLAGAAAVDITPPPGFYTGGHSKEGRLARGQFGDLRATAFYFRDESGSPIVLISADLFAVSTDLHQAVAAEIGVPLERVILSASHTHHGPGNFLSTRVYNALGSHKGGYDARLRDFLVARITQAAKAAKIDAEAHATSDVEIVSGLLPRTLLRNRSPRVFMLNDNKDVMLRELGGDIPEDCASEMQPLEPTDAWDEPGCPRLRGVDRHATLLQIRRGGHVAALAVFMAVHPTVLPARTKLYSPDFFGVARSALETHAPIVAFFNGAEGDVTTRRTARDAKDLARLGGLLAAELKQILQGGTTRRLRLTSSQARLQFARAGESALDVYGRRWTLATTAVGGMAVLGGAEDDATMFSAFPFVRAKRRTPHGEHGVKLPALEWLYPPSSYPQVLPLSVIRLPGFVLAAVPSELSTATGFAIREQLGVPRDEFALIGLANEYASYTATEDEYAAQDYMGASTLWGPQQAGFFAAALRQLGQPGVPVTGEAADPESNRGGRAEFGPRKLPPAKQDRVKDYRALLGAAAEKLPHFTFCTGPLDALPGFRAQDVDIVDGAGAVVDRSVVVLLDRRPTSNGARWTAVWAAPLWRPMRGTFRFRIRTHTHEILSNPFVTNGPPPQNACGYKNGDGQ